MAAHQETWPVAGLCRTLLKTGKFGFTSHGFSKVRLSNFAATRQLCDRAIMPRGGTTKHEKGLALVRPPDKA